MSADSSASATMLDTTTTDSPGKKLMLWTIFVIALASIAVLLMVVCVVVAVCYRVRRSRKRRRYMYVHQTNSRLGSQRSVEYSLKSPDGARLDNHHYNYVDVLEGQDDDNGTGDNAQPQDYLTPNVQRKPKKRTVHGESTLYDNLGPLVTSTPTEQTTASGPRVAVPSFITIDHEDSEEQPGEEDTRESSNQFTETAGPPQLQEEEEAGLTAIEDTATQSQTQTPGEGEGHHQLDTFEDGTMLADVPMFSDPEIGESLQVPSQPTIYSSQILTTVDEVERNEAEVQKQEERVDNGESVQVPLIYVDTEHPSRDSDSPNTSIQKSASLCVDDPDYMEVDRIKTSGKDGTINTTDQRQSPEGAAQMSQDSLSRSQQVDGYKKEDKEEVVYDEPVITKHEDKRCSNQHSNQVTIFDDPKYTEVVLKTETNEKSELLETSQNVPRPDTLNLVQPTATDRTLWSSMSQDSENRSLSKKSSGLQYSKDDMFLPDESQSIKVQRLPLNSEPIGAQVARTSRKSHNIMKSSIDSLELLDYHDEELEELDPAIAPCLQRTPPEKQNSSHGGLARETRV